MVVENQERIKWVQLRDAGVYDTNSEWCHQYIWSRRRIAVIRFIVVTPTFPICTVNRFLCFMEAIAIATTVFSFSGHPNLVRAAGRKAEIVVQLQLNLKVEVCCSIRPSDPAFLSRRDSWARDTRVRRTQTIYTRRWTRSKRPSGLIGLVVVISARCWMKCTNDRHPSQTRLIRAMGKVPRV